MSAPHPSGGSPRNAGYRNQGHPQQKGKESIDCKELAWVQRIQFQYPLNPELFSRFAEDAAREVGQVGKEKNKPSQLRRFYDEIIQWEEKLRVHPEKFEEYLPFIRMLHAKAAYAKGRKVVTEHFVCLIEHTINQIQDPKSMGTCKLFWEAFMGFYKAERPSD